MKYIVSWSGGKDCCLALYKAQKTYGKPTQLLTSVPADKNSVMAHGYREEIIKLQAEALDVEIDFMYFQAKQYREAYVDKLKDLKSKQAISHVVYGDLYLNEHRVWLQEVCDEVGLQALFPAWIRPEQVDDLFEEYLELGFKSILVNINKQFLGKEWLGKTIDKSLGEFAKGQFCPMAEAGEYHSLVVDGPLFNKALKICKHHTIEEDTCFKMAIEKVELISK